MPLRINHAYIRQLFLLFAVAVFGCIFALGTAVWFALPDVISYLARERSSLVYDWFYRSPLPAAAAQASGGNAASVPVLLYHGEGSASDMPLGRFVAQLRALKMAGWRTVTLAEFEEYLAGNRTLPDKSFLLTFDDGRKDTYYQADPVLKDLDYTAVMFVITGYSLPQNGVRNDFYLSQTELARMQASGRWELESHGNLDHGTYAVQSTLDPSQEAKTVDGHYLSDKFWENGAARFETDAEFTARVTNDLSTSKQLLANTFGTTVNAFAYPFNDFGEDSVNFPGSAAILDRVVPQLYAYAFYQTWQGNGDTFNYPGADNGPGSTAYMVKRIEPTAAWSGTDLVDTLNEGRVKPLPYSAQSFGNEWARDWGVVKLGTSLGLDASPNTTGAAALLNGSGAWRDYRMNVQAERKAGTAISLIARDRNGSDNVVCAFSDQLVSIERHVGGTQETLVKKTYQVPLTGQFSVSVTGQSVSCAVDGAEVIAAPMPASVPKMGGVGLQSWSRDTGTASVTVRGVQVMPL